MPLPHNSATAKVTIDGLGICCFNHRRQFWEVGYLRHDQHNHVLALEIDGNPVPLESSGRDAVIRIETLNGISPYRDFPDGFYGRERIADRTKNPAQMSDDEKENFRWAIDLEDPWDEMKQGRGNLFKPASFAVTRAFISDAVFYTSLLAPTDLFNLPMAENGSTMSEQELQARIFGKTNNLTAGDITCARDGAINVIIEDGHGHSQVIRLDHRPGDPHQINLTNMRPGGLSFGGHDDHDHDHDHDHDQEAPQVENVKGPEHPRPEKGDYQLYYTAFNLADNRKQRALWGFPEEIQSGRTDCNLVWVSTTDDLDALY
ncbi:MAG TPA: hypothetical protein VLB46_22550 [Pyrinomonadaceae bacterium]|nr:hypothetical protein [Pyrinomonadaceae bacterium]